MATSQSGHVQDPMTLVGKYRSGYTGKVLTEFSKPSPLEIKPAHDKQDAAREAYGYSRQTKHPTPTSPYYEAVYK